MATARNLDAYPILIVPRLGLTYADAFDRSASTFTEAGPQPGECVDQGTSLMSLQSGGAQAAGTSYRVRVQRAGLPGESGVVWYPTADGASASRGHNPPTSLTHWEALEYSTTAQRRKQLHIITDRDANKVVVASLKDNRKIQVYAYDAGVISPGWDDTEVYDPGATYANVASPTLVQLPDGKLLCFFFVEGSSIAQVRMHVSDDGGASWTTAQRTCLREAIDTTVYTPVRLRAAYKDGVILLVAHVVDTTLTYKDILVQWASQDLGAHFSEIDRWTGADTTTQGGYPDITVANGRFVVGYLAGASGAIAPYVRRISDAFSPLSAAEYTKCQDAANPMEWGTSAAALFTDGDFAIASDELGTLYIVGRDVGDDHQCVTYMSFDGGYRWLDDALGGSSAAAYGPTWWDGADTSTHPRGMSATWQGAGLVVAHNFAANPGTADSSMCLARLGGWTTLEMPLETATSQHYARASWGPTWLPFDLPEDTGARWSASTTGTPTVTLDATTGALKVVQDPGERQYWTSVPTGTLSEGVAAVRGFEVVSGSAFLIIQIGQAGPASYQVRLEIQNGTITMRDMVAGADIGSPASYTPDRIYVLLHVRNTAGAPANDGEAVAYWRDADSDWDAEWNLIGSTSTLQKGAATANAIQSGGLTGAAEFYTWLWGESETGHLGEGFIDQSNPVDLQGRDIGAALGVLVDDLEVMAVSGPSRRGDEWQIDPLYDYGVDKMHPEEAPSPEEVWRSLDDASDVELIWNIPSTINTAGRWKSDSIGLVLLNCTQRTMELWAKDVFNAWSKLADIDTATGQNGLTFVRTARSVSPDTSATTSATRYFQYGALAGGSFETNGVVVGIDGNGEGAWSGNVATRRVNLDLSTDPLGMSAGDNDGAIRSRDVAVIVNNVGAYKAVKIVIPAQTTHTGYFQIGTRLFGHVAVMAKRPAAGRTEGVKHNTEIRESRSGRRRSKRLGEPQDYFEFGWDDLVVTKSLYATPPAPDYTQMYTGGAPVATRADTFYTMMGIYREMGGPEHPLVYCPRVTFSQNSSTVVTLLNPQEIVYGRFMSDAMAADTVRGDELYSAVLRGSRLRFEREL